jgi:hypothetical protein
MWRIKSRRERGREREREIERETGRDSRLSANSYSKNVTIQKEKKEPNKKKKWAVFLRWRKNKPYCLFEMF